MVLRANFRHITIVFAQINRMVGPLENRVQTLAVRHRHHIFAVGVFLILTIMMLRVFLFDDSLFTYRDLTWSNNLDAMISDMTSTLDLESSRRIVFLGPLLYGSQLLGLTGIAAEKILFLVSGSATGIIAYFSIFKFLESKVGRDKRKTIFIVALFGAFMYSFNPIVTSQLSTTLFFVISYSLLPLIFYYFDKTLSEGKFQNIFITGILISLALAGTTQFLALLPVFVLLPWVLLLCVKAWSLREIRTILFRTSYVFLVTFGLSFYWIFISLMIMSEGIVLQPPYILTLDSLRLFSSENDMVNVIRLMGDWWPRVPLTPIIHDGFWTTLTFVIPITSVLFLIRVRRSKLGYYIVAFTLIGLFAIFFYKGSQPPLQDLYAATYSLPVIGWMFRIPQKIGIMLPLFVTMIISLGMYELLATRNRKALQSLKYVAMGGLVVTAAIINWPPFTGDFAGIYESRRASTGSPAQEAMDVSTSGSMVTIFGGGQKHSLLSTVDSFDSSRYSVALADRKLGPGHLESSGVVVLDDKENLMAHFLPEDAIIVKPFDATDRHAPGSVWSRAGTDNPLHGPFDNYLMSLHGIANSDKDYGMGVLLTWASDRIDLPVWIERTDQYDLLVRLLKSEAGGPLRVYLDGILISQMDTKDRANKFSVMQIDSREIQSGTHTITLENVSGLNAVNILALAPSSKMPEADTKLRDYAQDVTNLYLYSAERDFLPVETGWQNHHQDVLAMSINADSPVSQDIRLQVDVKRGDSTVWNVISSDYIEVEQGSNIRYEFTAHGQDVNGLHSKVYYFDADKKPFYNEFVMGGMSGTFTHSASKTLSTPEGAAYANLQFWIRPNPAQASSYLVENITLTNGGLEAGSAQSRIIINHGASIVKTVDILKESQYAVSVRAQFCSDCGTIIASIGDDSRWFSLESENEESRWLTFTTFLPAQETELRVTSIGKAQVDTVAVYSESTDQLFSSSAPAILEYDKVSTTKYLVTTNSDGPFVLKLLQTYDPLWIAKVDGQSISPIQLYGGQNGFLIDRSGVSQIEMQYQPQQWFYIGGLASLVFFSASMLYLIRTKINRIGGYLRQRIGDQDAQR
jgi:hypothetical protein